MTHDHFVTHLLENFIALLLSRQSGDLCRYFRSKHSKYSQAFFYLSKLNFFFRNFKLLSLELRWNKPPFISRIALFISENSLDIMTNPIAKKCFDWVISDSNGFLANDNFDLTWMNSHNFIRLFIFVNRIDLPSRKMFPCRLF